MRYFISDTHWNHKNIIKYCNRPFSSVEEMNETLIKNWNSVVTDNDEVFHCGDFCWNYEYKKWTDRLNGKKYLILGNHCNVYFAEGNFLKIYNSLQIEIAGRKVNLSHYPYRKELQLFEPTRYKKFEHFCLGDDANWLIHGHVHDSQPLVTKKMINVSCENINYTPISETEIIKIMESYV